jgi:hypothetical protein
LIAAGHDRLGREELANANSRASVILLSADRIKDNRRLERDSIQVETSQEFS